MPPEEKAEIPEDTEYYNEETLFKVYESLRRSGLSDSACRSAVNQMQNDGILFRERT